MRLASTYVRELVGLRTRIPAARAAAGLVPDGDEAAAEHRDAEEDAVDDDARRRAISTVFGMPADFARAKRASPGSPTRSRRRS